MSDKGMSYFLYPLRLFKIVIIIRHLLFIAGLLILPNPTFAQENPGNPQPLPDDLILPMPNGRSMAFRPVCIGEGGGSYSWKRFRLGDPSGGYKESPTGVALGGTFKVSKSGGDDWCYYIGKYEVTEDQFFALYQDRAELKDSTLPVRDISWFEANDFVRAYNDWLYGNAKQDVPEYGGLPGYLRLPTEVEWEFAARGGSAVDSAAFDRKAPYPVNELTQYEWYAGPESSHNKVKKTGVLKPNPLGLHDMLGNVSEMTWTLYQVEYYQGRSGGFVAKGGHFLTDAKQLRSSLRTEQEFYSLDSKTNKIAPGKKSTLGFRVVLSSLVFPNRQVSTQMEEDWDAYRQGIAASLPAAVSTSPTSTKTKVSGTDAASHLDRLKSEMAKSGAIPDHVQQELDLLAASLSDIQFTIQQAEKDSAYAWLKIGSEQAFFIFKESRKLPILEELKKSAQQANRAEILLKYQEREVEIQQNISQAMNSYTESIRQLGETGSAAIADAFTRYTQFLKSKKADQQLGLLPTVKQHADFAMKEKRTDDELWKRQLLEGGVGK